MPEFTSDKLPGENGEDFYMDWRVERIDYRLHQQEIEFHLGGPFGATEYWVHARFGRAVYLRLYSQWDVPFFKGWEPDVSVCYFREEQELPELTGRFRSNWTGLILSLPVGNTREVSDEQVAPPDTSLRAFILVTNDLTMQWLCAEVEVRHNFTWPPPWATLPNP